MQVSKYAVLCTVAAVIRKYKGTYAYASQAAYLEMLWKYHKIKFSRRQLNYHLADLRKEGFIKSYKRSGRKDDGTVYLKTSAICLTIKGCMMLMNKGYSWAAQHLTRLRKFFVPFFQSQIQHHQEGLPANEKVQPVTVKDKIREAKEKGIGLYNLIIQGAKACPDT